MVGDRAGSFAEYRLEAVAGEQLTITMENLPIDPAFGQSIGFRMYGPDGKLAAKGVEMRPFYWWDTLMAPLTGLPAAASSSRNSAMRIRRSPVRL